MPAPKVKSKAQKQDTNRNSKFDEIQKKNLEILKQRVNSYDDDSDEEEVEIDKSKVEALFRNYQGNEIDVARVAQFFESGENIDCLICKYVCVIFHRQLISFISRHSTSEN